MLQKAFELTVGVGLGAIVLYIISLIVISLMVTTKVLQKMAKEKLLFGKYKFLGLLTSGNKRICTLQKKPAKK